MPRTYGGNLFVPYPPAMVELLHGQRGPIARDLIRKAVRVTSGAKRRCPVDTGRLRSSIRWTLMGDWRGLYARVGTDVKYAIFVHEGTREHDVQSARGPGTALRFVVGGNVVFIKWPRSVTIPSQPPRRFLYDALEDIRV